MEPSKATSAAAEMTLDPLESAIPVSSRKNTSKPCGTNKAETNLADGIDGRRFAARDDLLPDLRELP